MDDIKEHLVEIKEQTTKTNGRVTKLEEGVMSLTNYKYLMVGGLSVITLLVIPLVIYVWNQNMNKEHISKTVSNAVTSSLTQVLSPYNIEVE